MYFFFFTIAGNGYIPTTCLKEILRELDDQLTNEELDMMIDEIDSDGSGTVDFDGNFFQFSIISNTSLSRVLFTSISRLTLIVNFLAEFRGNSSHMFNNLV